MLRFIFSFSGILILLILFSCKAQSVITIVVHDAANNDLPISNARLEFRPENFQGDSAQIFFTNEDGKFKVKTQQLPELSLVIRASKEKHLAYIDLKEEQKSSTIYLAENNIKAQKEIHLFLSSDSINYQEYIASTNPQMPIREFMEMVKSGEYKPLFLPWMSWEDIPILLEYAKDTTWVEYYPSNFYSSFRQAKIPIAVFALWMIESIRFSPKKEKNKAGAQKYASLNPRIFSNEKNSFVDGLEGVAEIRNYYKEWYESYKEMPEFAKSRNLFFKKNFNWANDHMFYNN